MCNDPVQEEIEGIQPGYGTPESQLLKKIMEAGFKPIAITVLACEETFIFQGSADVDKAWELFKPEGWWYTLDEWVEVYNEEIKKLYNGDENLAPKIFWLDENYAPKEK